MLVAQQKLGENIKSTLISELIWIKQVYLRI